MLKYDSLGASVYVKAISIERGGGAKRSVGTVRAYSRRGGLPQLDAPPSMAPNARLRNPCTSVAARCCGSSLLWHVCSSPSVRVKAIGRCACVVMPSCSLQREVVGGEWGAMSAARASSKSAARGAAGGSLACCVLASLLEGATLRRRSPPGRRLSTRMGGATPRLERCPRLSGQNPRVPRRRRRSCVARMSLCMWLYFAAVASRPMCVHPLPRHCCVYVDGRRAPRAYSGGSGRLREP